MEKDKLWGLVGKSAHTALKLKEQLPLFKEQFSQAKEQPALAMTGAAVVGYSKSKLPRSDKIASLIKAIQRQNVQIPFVGGNIGIGKYNAQGAVRGYNRRTDRLEFDNLPAYGINLTKRF